MRSGSSSPGLRCSRSCSPVYVDLPAIGPLPAMYEPLWFPEKAVSAAAEALAAVLAALALTRKPFPRPPRPLTLDTTHPGLLRRPCRGQGRPSR